MQVRYIELFFHLFPAVLEDIGTFLLGLEFIVSGEGHGFVLAAGKVQLDQVAATANEQRLAVCRRVELTHYVLFEHGDIALLNIEYAKVEALFQALGEVEFFSVLGKIMVAHPIRETRQPADAVLAVG